MPRPMQARTYALALLAAGFGLFLAVAATNFVVDPTGVFGTNIFPHPAFNERYAKFSPDGHWVSYESDESGRYEIYIAPFPGPGGKRQISLGGGTFPRWRADGKEIFYAAPNGKLMAAEVSIKGATIEVGGTQPMGITLLLLAGPYGYDVFADGQRFLVAAPVEQKSAAPLTLVQNWTALLKKK